jgi:hypothetical protein
MGAYRMIFVVTGKAFRPASDKLTLGFNVAGPGTRHLGIGASQANVSLLAANAKGRPDYLWFAGTGTVTVSRGFKKGSLDVTLPPDKIAGVLVTKATAKETVVGNWDCG